MNAKGDVLRPGRIRERAAALALVLALLGAAPVHAQTADPLEPANRKVFTFNDTLDRWIVKPVAKGYNRLPEPMKRGVNNVFRNLEEPGTIINQFLQGKPRNGLNDTARFLVNSTFGLLGWFDVATKAGLQRHEEDFGQTFSVWGVGRGPFVMLPALGPSTTTDTVGRVLDFFTNPVSFINPERDQYIARGVNLLDTRAQLLSVEEIVSGDRYLFMRDAYLQRRLYLINDGVIDEDPFLDEFDDFDEEFDAGYEEGTTDGAAVAPQEPGR